MDRVISIVGHTALDYIVNVEKIAGKNESSPIIDYEEYPGGGAANIAVAIAKLGGKSQLISPVGLKTEKFPRRSFLRIKRAIKQHIFTGELLQNSKNWNPYLWILSI